MLNTSSLPGGTRWPRAASSVRWCSLVGGEMQAPLVSNFRIHGSGLLPGLFKPLQPRFAWLCKCFGRRPSGIPRSRTRELYGSLLYAPGPSVFRLATYICIYINICVCANVHFDDGEHLLHLAAVLSWIPRSRALKSRIWLQIYSIWLAILSHDAPACQLALCMSV